MMRSLERQGLLIPFRRDRKRDFASGCAADLLRSKVEQVLMTEAGELPWRTNFGAGLSQLRHQRNDAVLRELARVQVRDALRRWVPSAEILSLEVVSNSTSLTLHLHVRERATGIEAQAEVLL